MSDPEQQPPDLPKGEVKRRSRALRITLIVILCVVVALAIAWYVLWIDISNQVDGWWNEIKGGAGGPGDLDAGNL